MLLLGNRLDPRFCPHAHSVRPRQQFFLQIDDFEALFGGAAAGGKSDALLMAYLQFVDQPHYRGLILRRKSVDLERSDAILDRACRWWLPTSRTGVRYEKGRKTFIFPSGATCQFGHANNVGDEVENYQGGAWHFIAFDEVTQFAPQQYTYLFSRLRPPDGAAGYTEIPLRMRCASNPGGVSHNFIRDRFMSLEYAREFLDGTAAPAYIRDIRFEFEDLVLENRRWFVPSKVQDGAMDIRTVVMGLSQVDPLERERLLAGNWLISAAGRFKPEWFRRYRCDSNGWLRLLNKDGAIASSINSADDVYCFFTVDVAGTEKEMNQVARGKRKDPSYSVVSVWWHIKSLGALAWRHVWRRQVETPDLKTAIRELRKEFKPQSIYIEVNGIGRPVYQDLSREGLPVVSIEAKGDKLARSVPAAIEASEGRVYLPASAPWLDACEAELFAWQGSSDEQCDQIDTFSHAAKCKVDGFVGDTIEWAGGR